jgi:hypothetical protein
MQQKIMVQQHWWWHEMRESMVGEMSKSLFGAEWNVVCVPGVHYNGLKSGALPMLHYQDLAS